MANFNESQTLRTAMSLAMQIGPFRLRVAFGCMQRQTLHIQQCLMTALGPLLLPAAKKKAKVWSECLQTSLDVSVKCAKKLDRWVG